MIELLHCAKHRGYSRCYTCEPFDRLAMHLVGCAPEGPVREVTSMNLLETYSQCLKAGDGVGMGALFAEDAEFYDEAPAKVGLDSIRVRGRRNIEEFFKQTFKHGGMNVSNIGINGNAMRYDVAVGKIVLLCLGEVKEEKGLIKQYRVIAV
jgi:hypothetical protein